MDISYQDLTIWREGILLGGIFHYYTHIMAKTLHAVCSENILVTFSQTDRYRSSRFSLQPFRYLSTTISYMPFITRTIQVWVSQSHQWTQHGNEAFVFARPNISTLSDLPDLWDLWDIRFAWLVRARVVERGVKTRRSSKSRSLVNAFFSINFLIVLFKFF